MSYEINILKTKSDSTHFSKDPALIKATFGCCPSLFLTRI